MARTTDISDEQILKTLGDADGPLTAAQVGVPSARLKVTKGVKHVGALQTGKAGRPALLFALA